MLRVYAHDSAVTTGVGVAAGAVAGAVVVVVADDGACGDVELLLQAVNQANVSADASRPAFLRESWITAADSTCLWPSYTPTRSPLAPTTGSMNW